MDAVVLLRVIFVCKADTVTLHVDVVPSVAVAVIIALPVVSVVTTPFADIAATVVALEDQVRVCTGFLVELV